MDIQLTPENDQFLRQQMAKGAIDTPSQLANAGLDLLRQRDALARLDQGLRQLDAGNVTEYDRAGLRARLEELKKRALEAHRRNLEDPGQ
jgi:hypothetical protein